MKLAAMLTAAILGAGAIAFSTTAGAMPRATAPALTASDDGLVVQVQQQQRNRHNNTNNNRGPNNNAHRGNHRGNNRGNNNDAAVAAGVLGVIGGIIASQNQPDVVYVDEPRRRRHYRGRDRHDCRFGSYRGRDGYRHCRSPR